MSCKCVLSVFIEHKRTPVDIQTVMKQLHPGDMRVNRPLYIKKVLVAAKAAEL